MPRDIHVAILDPIRELSGRRALNPRRTTNREAQLPTQHSSPPTEDSPGNHRRRSACRSHQASSTHTPSWILTDPGPNCRRARAYLTARRRATASQFASHPPSARRGTARGAERGWKGNAVVEREDDARGPRPASIICHPGFLFLRRGSRLARHPRPSASGAALAFPPVRPRGLYAPGRSCPSFPTRRAFPFSGGLRRVAGRRRAGATRGVGSVVAVRLPGGGAGRARAARPCVSPCLPTKRLPLYWTVLYSSPVG